MCWDTLLCVVVMCYCYVLQDAAADEDQKPEGTSSVYFVYLTSIISFLCTN